VTIKEELHRWVDALSDDQASEVLEDLRALRSRDRMPVPEWQKEEILRRKAASLANPGSGVDWETVKQEIRSRRGH
jgi:hypothetical protein